MRAHPLCAMHFERGRIVAATVVDHKVPHRLKEAMDGGDATVIAEAKALFWDSGNWQSLCKPCHDGAKQRFERTGRVTGCDLSGMPVDPAHHWARGK